MNPSSWARSPRLRVPIPASAASATAPGTPLRRMRAGQGAARSATTTAAASMSSWAACHSRYAPLSGSSVRGTTATAVNGGYTNGRLPRSSGAISAACSGAWRAWSYMAPPWPSRSRLAPTYVAVKSEVPMLAVLTPPHSTTYAARRAMAAVATTAAAGRRGRDMGRGEGSIEPGRAHRLRATAR